MLLFVPFVCLFVYSNIMSYRVYTGTHIYTHTHHIHTHLTHRPKIKKRGTKKSNYFGFILFKTSSFHFHLEFMIHKKAS